MSDSACRMALLVTMLLTAAGCGVVATTAKPQSPGASQAPPAGQPAPPDRVQAIAPMNRTVEDRLFPQVDRLLVRLMDEGRDMRIDGQPVFNGGDKFLPGKIAMGMAYVLLDKPRGSPEFRLYLDGFRRIADLTVDDQNTEWGIYYYLHALYKLDQAGLLDAAVAPETLATLRIKLDWRTFVRQSDLTLIGLPNNYYGVAYSIAQLRQQLGWEDGRAADALLDKTLEHYRTYSDYGFADETDGEGRYDRYSVLLIGEIAQRFIEAGREPPADVKTWLKGSAQLLLLRAGPAGDGFEYGRSIGAYGETAMLEVLSAAAVLDVLTPEERDVAYALSSRITERYMDFWVDPATGSVNLWDHGRRTDTYRGKHRILGENLSLARQVMYTNALWNGLGYSNRTPTADLAAWRAGRPRATLTWFSRGTYERALITVRDGSRLFGLPFINGGPTQHMHNPYFPIPYSPGLISGSADAEFPQLVARITMDDGRVLQPLAYYSAITMSERGDDVHVTATAAAVDRMGDIAPRPDPQFAVKTEYVFGRGSIRRHDRYTPAGGQGTAALDMEFGNKGDARQVERRGADWHIAFDGSPLREFVVRGFDSCRIATALADAYRTPTGPMRALVSCHSDRQPIDRPFELEWQVSYDRQTRAVE